jgi:hypothetical protein
MEANIPKWVLLILAVPATALSLNDVCADEVAYQLTDSIEQIGATTSASDSNANEPVLEFSLPESTRTPPSLDCRGTARLPFQTDLYQDFVRHVEKPTLPMQRLVKRYGIFPLEPVLNATSQLTENISSTATPEVPKRIDQAMRDAFYCLVPGMPRISEAIDACFPERSQQAVTKYDELQLTELSDCLNATEEKLPATAIESLLSRSEQVNAPTSVPGSAPRKLDPYFPSAPSPIDNSFSWVLAETGPGVRRITIPAHGPAPVRLDFAFPPVFEEGTIRQFDAPARRAPQLSTEPLQWKWTPAMNG